MFKLIDNIKSVFGKGFLYYWNEFLHADAFTALVTMLGVIYMVGFVCCVIYGVIGIYKED